MPGFFSGSLQPRAEHVHLALRNRIIEYDPPTSLFDGNPLPLWGTDLTDADALFTQPATESGGSYRYLFTETDPEPEPSSHNWALMVTRDVERAQTDLGGFRFEVSGAVIIDVFVLSREMRSRSLAASTAAVDSADALLIAGELARVYDSGAARVPGGGRALLRGASINEVGISGKWYQVRVTAPYNYYQTR